MRRKKTKSMLILALLLLGLTVGYAVLSTNLSINGTSTINKPTWDIHFENIVTKSGSVTPTTAAAISNQGKTVTYAVTLNIPGDFYEFNVDVKNAGTIDGMIESITSTVNGQPISNLPSYVEYYVTYSDGVEIGENQLLTAGSKLTYTVHIGFKRDINPEDLPGNNQTYNLSMGFTDTQAGSEAAPKPTYVYTLNPSSNQIKIGNAIPSGITTYNDYNGFLDEYGFAIFLRHAIVNNKVVESWVGFTLPDEWAADMPNGHAGTYFLKGGDGGAAYNQNTTTLLYVFGAANCNVDENGIGCYYPYPSASSSGVVSFIISGGNGCSISEDGSSYCSY